MIPALLFYVFSAVMLASATMVVTARNPVHAVLFLILCFFNAAALFLLMGAEFIAFILVIVYVGAVAVLFLFVVMMLDINFRDLRQQARRYVPIGLAVTLVLLAQLVLMAGNWVTGPDAMTTAAQASPDGLIENTRAIGRVLYTDYFFPFQVSGLVLLVAMLGAIVLTLRDRKDVLRQNTAKQMERPVDQVLAVRQISSGQGVDV